MAAPITKSHGFHGPRFRNSAANDAFYPFRCMAEHGLGRLSWWRAGCSDDPFGSGPRVGTGDRAVPRDPAAEAWRAAPRTQAPCVGAPSSWGRPSAAAACPGCMRAPSVALTPGFLLASSAQEGSDRVHSRRARPRRPQLGAKRPHVTRLWRSCVLCRSPVRDTSKGWSVLRGTKCASRS